MKKFTLLATGLALSAASFAQFSFGVQATGNLSDARIKEINEVDFKKTVRAFPGAGLVVQYALSKHLALRSGVNFLKNGVTLKTTLDESVDMDVKIEHNLDYVQIPLTVLYTLPVSRVQVYGGAGGYFNYGIGGKVKYTLSYTMPDGHRSVTLEQEKAFKKEEDDGAGLKRSDFGLTGLAGIRLGNGLFIHASYQLSLSDISGELLDQYKHRGVQLTVGYFF